MLHGAVCRLLCKALRCFSKPVYRLVSTWKFCLPQDEFPQVSLLAMAWASIQPYNPTSSPSSPSPLLEGDTHTLEQIVCSCLNRTVSMEGSAMHANVWPSWRATGRPGRLLHLVSHERQGALSKEGTCLGFLAFFFEASRFLLCLRANMETETGQRTCLEMRTEVVGH